MWLLQRGHPDDADAQPEVCVRPKAPHKSAAGAATANLLEIVRDGNGSARQNEYA